MPKYPNLLSENLGEARSLRHSICPKCVRSPKVNKYNSFATLFRLIAPSVNVSVYLIYPTPSYLTLGSLLSSLKLALMAALSFCTTALSSAIVFEARTLRMNCFTASVQPRPSSILEFILQELIVISGHETRFVEGVSKMFA